MNRDDAANLDLVNQWRVAGAPLPLLLVISPKGNPTGGFVLNDATAEKLVALIPSPKMDDVYTAINNGKSVFLIITKTSFTDRPKIIENCNTANAQLKTKAVIIEIDPTDTKEQDFLKQLNLKNTSNTSTTIVINAAGQTTGSFEGAVDINQLVLAANKVAKSGCCPGGSSIGSCAPKK